MEIRQLRYFQVIAREHQITSAAKILHITQPPLSQQLRLLEEELGIRLFDRSTKRMELTEEGKVFLHYVNQLLEEFDSTVRVFHEISSGTRGMVHIGTIGSAAVRFLPMMTDHFLEENPGVQIQVYEASTKVLLKMMDQDEIELGLVKEPINADDYHYINLMSPEEDMRYCVYGTPEMLKGIGKYVSLQEIKDIPVIIHRMNHDSFLNACNQLHIAPNIICEDENIMTSVGLALGGIGAAIVPEKDISVISSLLECGRLACSNLTDDLLGTGTALIWKRKHVLTAAAERFVKSVEIELNMKNNMYS